MEYEIMFSPTYSLLKTDLRAGQKVVAEAGAMVSMSGGIRIETGIRGGLFGALKRAIFGKETFFLNTFTAESSGEVCFAPPLPGDIKEFTLEDKTLFAQSGTFIASEEGVKIDVQWGGARTFFSREGLFLLKLTGRGKVFLSCYGAIREIELAAGQRYIVDTGHMVAFTEGVGYNVKRVGGIKSTLFSGEGLVCELTGPGKIMVQTRSEEAFLSWLIPLLPSRSSGSDKPGFGINPGGNPANI